MNILFLMKKMTWILTIVLLYSDSRETSWLSEYTNQQRRL